MDSRSKYANLPFVAVGEKDVFETDDLPEADQMPAREPLFDASVDVIACGTLEAFHKFKESTSETLEKVLFRSSDRIIKLFYFQASNESLLEKYNRLTEEIKEITEITAKDTNDLDKDLVVKVDKLSEQLQELQLLRYDNSSTLKEMFDTIDRSETKLAEDEDNDRFQVRYKLWYRPERDGLKDMSKINSFEQRIKNIETILGANDNKLAILNNCLKDKSLSETVQELRAKVSQLDQSSLERVDSRLHMITDKLNQIAERKPQFEDLERNSKINELYDLMTTTEKTRSALPNILHRLEALSQLQEQGLS